MFSCRYKSYYNAEKKIWFGSKTRETFHPKITLGETIRFFLERNPQKVGQISDNNEIHMTNEEILLRSLKIAVFVEKLNLMKSDVVGVIGRNTENLAPLIFGLLYCGVSINTLDPNFDEDEIINMFKYTKPKAIFCDADRYSTTESALREMGMNVPILIIEGIPMHGAVSVKNILDRVSAKEARQFEPNYPEDGRKHIAFILCSSGTTGPSKGVCLSHASFIHLPLNRKFEEDDVVFCFSSLYWLSGVAMLLIGTLSAKTRVITDQLFSPELMLRIIEKYGVTKIISPPSQLAMITEHPDIKTRNLTSLKEYFCGGSSVPPSLCDKINQILMKNVVTVVYSMTEAGGNGAANMFTLKTGAVGQLAENIEVRIVDDAEINQGPNQDGEIYLRPRYPFLGYYGRSSDTSKTLDSDGWIHTGDIGHFDSEGDLFIVDRKKDIMKYKNYQYSPTEIENFLLRIPGISQVCVCGIPDPIATDLPAALIILQSGAKISTREIEELMRKSLSDHKQLRGGIYIVENLPMTPSGKYQRDKVKQLAINFYNDRINDNLIKNGK